MASVEFGGGMSDPVAGSCGEDRLNTPREDEEENVVPVKEDWIRSSRSSNDESIVHQLCSRPLQL